MICKGNHIFVKQVTQVIFFRYGVLISSNFNRPENFRAIFLLMLLRNFLAWGPGRVTVAQAGYFMPSTIKATMFVFGVAFAIRRSLSAVSFRLWTGGLRGHLPLQTSLYYKIKCGSVIQSLLESSLSPAVGGHHGYLYSHLPVTRLGQPVPVIRIRSTRVER